MDHIYNQKKKTTLKVNFPIFKIAILKSKTNAILFQLKLQRMSYQSKSAGKES